MPGTPLPTPGVQEAASYRHHWNHRHHWLDAPSTRHNLASIANIRLMVIADPQRRRPDPVSAVAGGDFRYERRAGLAQLRIVKEELKVRSSRYQDAERQGHHVQSPTNGWKLIRQRGRRSRQSPGLVQSQNSREARDDM